MDYNHNSKTNTKKRKEIKVSNKDNHITISGFKITLKILTKVGLFQMKFK